MIRLGVIGFSPGNGHPFSFSAIVNGYDDDGFAHAGWPVIHDYLKRREPEDFGFDDVAVTAAWSPDANVTAKLCAACKIKTALSNVADMIGQVDAVMILRDDPESHWPLAQPFLEAGLPVFVDKPLAATVEDLNRFLPYLVQGKVMSTAGLRNATELDPIRGKLDSFGPIRQIDGVVLNDWRKYGIHMLDAAIGLLGEVPQTLVRNEAKHESFDVTFENGTLMAINALGETTVPVFSLSVYGKNRQEHFQLLDNFSAFRNTLAGFIDQIRTGDASIPVRETVHSIATIIAGSGLKPGGYVNINTFIREHCEGYDQ